MHKKEMEIHLKISSHESALIYPDPIRRVNILSCLSITYNSLAFILHLWTGLFSLLSVLLLFLLQAS
jgi:hypothetical protein